MISETCSCGASITADDPHTITQSRVEDWRANHRHDVSQIEPSGHEYTGPITVETATATTTARAAFQAFKDWESAEDAVYDDTEWQAAYSDLHADGMATPEQMEAAALLDMGKRVKENDDHARAAEPLPSVDAETFTLVYRPGDEHSWADEFAWLLRNHGPRLADLLEDVKDAQGFRESIKVGRDGRVWDGHHRVLVAHLAHLMVEVEVAEEPDPAQTSPDGEASTPHATASHRSLTSVAPAGEEHGAPEPPAGTPVWWDGRWWHGGPGLPYYCMTGPLDEHCWSDMPGAVPALTPEQVDRLIYDKARTAERIGREAAARDVEALMRWRGVWVDADDAVRAARGQA